LISSIDQEPSSLIACHQNSVMGLLVVLELVEVVVVEPSAYLQSLIALTKPVF